MAYFLLALLLAGPSVALEHTCVSEVLDLTSLMQVEQPIIADGAGPAQLFEAGRRALNRRGSLSVSSGVNDTSEPAALANKLDLAELISKGALRKEAALMGVVSPSARGGKHILVVVLILLGFLLPGVGWIFARCLGQFVKTSIESLDRTVIGVDVTIGKLSINPIQARVDVEDVTVFNPEGYQAPYLMKIDSVSVDIDASALFYSFGKDIVVDELIFTGMDTIYAKTWTSSNFNDVMSFIDGGSAAVSASDPADAEDDTKPQKPKSSGRSITFHRVRVEDVGMKMELEIGGGVGPRLEVGDINYEDFSTEVGGAMLRTAVSLLLRTILKSVVVTALGRSVHKRTSFSEMSFLGSQAGESEGRRHSSCRQS